MSKYNSPVFPILPSFYENEALDLESVSKYTSFLEENSVKRIMTTAGTSQFNLLNNDEIRDFNICVAKSFSGFKILTLPVLSKYHILKEVEFYNSLNLENTCLMFIFPDRFYSINQVYTYFREIADKSIYPIYTHNNPIKKSKGGYYEYSQELIDLLATIPTYKGFKEENSSVDFSTYNIRNQNLDVIVAGGSMRRFWQLCHYGATSWLVGIGSFVPKIELQFYNDFINNDFKSCKDLLKKEDELFQVSRKTGWHNLMRFILNKNNFIKYNRSPFPIISDDDKLLCIEILGRINND